MKANTSAYVIFLCLLAGILAACNANPQDVINSWQEAINKGDIDQALSYLAEDATVTIAPPGPDGDGVYNGRNEIRGWYEILTSGKGVGTLSNCTVQGETITCLSTYADDGLKSMGVDFLEGDWVAVVRDGKIQSYTFTTRPDSLAKLLPAEPETVATLPPQAVADAWTKALAAGEIDTALSYLAENAVVSIVPAGPDGDGVYNGQAEIRGWYETIVAAKGVGTLSNCQTEGTNLTCLITYTDEGLKALGVDFIEGDWVAVIDNGKIQSYLFTIRPESLKKFPAPEPTPITEVRITMPEKIAGQWEGAYNGYIVLHDFRADGTLLVNVSDIGLISYSKYWFDGDLLKIEDKTGDCMGIIGSYELYAIYNGDEPVELRFVLVGEDACADRKGTLAGKKLIRR